MDAAPLTAAHAYARAAYAVSESHGSYKKKHNAASEKFREAAKGANDSEASRILRLLEEHHEKLSRIVKSPAEHAERADADAPPSPKSRDKDDFPNTGTSAQSHIVATEFSKADDKSRRRSSPAAPRRLQRESSSSIAHDLATARGIPTAPQKSARQSLTKQSRLSGDVSTPPKIPENATASSTGFDRNAESPANRAAETAGAGSSDVAASEAAFQRFYSTIEGIWSKIPSPLAFTGLPLVQEDVDPTQSKTTTTRALAKATAPSNAPDAAKYFSPAAVRAVRDGNDQPGVHESFYFVPPGGGTMSYAGMLARERKHARSKSMLSENGEEVDDQFVDARETPPARPSLSRIARRTSSYRSPSSNKTFEELEEENAQLKQLTDELAAKIYEWEKNSQNQYAALHQSMRLMPQPARDSSATDKGRASEVHIRDLEEQIRTLQKDVECGRRENEKLSGVIVRYRERWEKLKDSARGRRESGGSIAGGAATAK